MTSRPVFHVLHDLGLATWFGGSLMGATGLNGAASALDDPRERARISTTGWSRWAPVNGAGLAAHLVGAGAILVNDWPRVRMQEGVGRSSAIKTALTAAGVGVAAWSAALNRKMASARDVPVAGATEPGALTPPEIARTQRQLQLAQWLNPLVSGALVGVTSWQAQQMRATQVAQGVLRRTPTMLTGSPLPLVGAVAAGALVVAARRRGGRQGMATDTAYPAEPLAAVGTPDGQATSSAPSPIAPAKATEPIPAVTPATPTPSETGSTMRSYGGGSGGAS